MDPKLFNKASQGDLVVQEQEQASKKIKKIGRASFINPKVLIPKQDNKKSDLLNETRNVAFNIVQQCDSYNQKQFKTQISPQRDCALHQAIENYRSERQEEHSRVLESICQFAPFTQK